MSSIIRRVKLFYAIYNLFNRSKLRHIEAQYKKRKVSKFYFSSLQSSDFKHLPAEQPWLDAANAAEVLPKTETYQHLPPSVKTALLRWSDDGYVILRQFFSTYEVKKINSEVENLVATDKVDIKYFGKKIMFGIDKSAYLMSIARNPQLIQILELLLGKAVIAFQSINFPTGSEQPTHSDALHMTTFPQGFLIAVWIALEDIDEQNGPLHYYPGSHKMPYLMNDAYAHGGNRFLLGEYAYDAYENTIQEYVKEKKLKKQVFKARKGDILIWHANLLHGGEPMLDKQRTRKSMVLHYFAKDVICFHEVTQRPALIDPKKIEST